MDLRHAVRVFCKSPQFTAAVLLVLALGIGSNSAIFSVLDKTVIRPLAYADPDRLVMVWEDFSAFGVPKSRVSPATMTDWRARSATLEQIGAYAGPMENALFGGGTPEQVLGLSVTSNLLRVLGVQPLAGRTFVNGEEGGKLVVLSYRLWQRRFGGDSGVVGKTVLINDERYSVIGIMPRGFQYPDRDTELWMPLSLSPEVWTRRNSHFLKVVGRMKAGSSLRQVQSDMQSVAQGLAREYPKTNGRVGIVVVPLKDEILGDRRTAYLLLLSAAGCVLLIGCANVGNLLLARASGRRREIAIRMALGASPRRVLRQILTENVVLAGAGGALGLAVAQASMTVLEKMLPAGLAGAVEIGLDWRAVAFTAGLSTLTGVLFGLGPAIQLSSVNLRTREGVGRSGGRMRDCLAVAEVGLALVLLIGATLLIETLARLRAVDPGFQPDHILTASIVAPNPKYADAGKRQQFYSDVLAKVRTIPGVRSAGLTSDLPYTSRGNTMGLSIESRQLENTDALFRLVSADYLQTMGARLKEGRFLSSGDRRESTPVVVINEAMARQFWPNESPLGRRVDTGTGDGKIRWMTIVGVVADIRERGLDLTNKAAVYVPFLQTEINFFQPSEIAVSTTRDPLSLSKELQRAVWTVDPERPVADLRTMDEIVDGELAGRTQLLQVLGAFAGLAMLLASVGVYGVLSYVVSQRTREIGLRLAIGAKPRDILRSVLGHSARLTGAGVAIGLLGALGATRWLASFLYGISPFDSVTFTGVATLLTAVSLAASYITARRAAGVDPMTALHEE
jgi:putative ABC transport system permease protein